MPKKFRKQAMLQVMLLFVNSIVDLLGLAVIIPLLAALLKEGFIEEQAQLRWMYHNFGFVNEKWFIVFICFIVFLVIVFKNLFGLWVNRRQMKFSWNIYEYICSRMYSSIYSKGLTFFNNTNSNQIQNRIVRVSQVISIMISTGIIQFLNELIVITFLLIFITIYNPHIILLLTVTVLPVFIIFYRNNAKKIKQAQIEINEISPRLTKPVFELSFGYVDVAVSGVFKSFKESFLTQVKQMKEKQVFVMISNQIPARLVEVSVITTVIIILLYGLFFLGSIETIITLLGVFGLAAYKLVPSINRLIVAMVNVKSWEFSIDIIEKNLEKDIPEQTDKTISFNSKISIEHLSYKFEDATDNLLDNISFEIKKGETVGLVGRSGSGKTTLMNMLLGFIQPTEGAIYIDEEKLGKDNTEAWHKIVGYVRQDVFLIDGSIAENIAFGVHKEAIDYAKLNEVIEIASLRDFVTSQPDGVETHIGERGTKISGGQKQRIGIARALYHGAEVLFFDEATSALDDKTEKEITESIESLSHQNLTMIIIAHRLTSLKYCDRVFEVGEKKINLKTQDNS